MTSLLSRVLDTVRAWFGLNDPSDNRMQPSHGWLLPPALDIRTRVLALAPAPSPSSVSSARGKRS